MPPAAAAAALIPAAAGALPGIAAAATGAGKSNASSKNFTESNAYNANRYEFGGRPGGADEMAQMERNRGEGFNSAAHGLIGDANAERNLSLQARGMGLESRGLGLESRGLGLEARNRQASMQDLMVNRAHGRNLISTRVADQARNNLGSSMASMAASARGPAGLANAQSDAMAARAQGIGQINSNEQIASMQEQLAAEQAAFGAASGMRQGDDAMRTGDATMRAGDDNMRGLDINQRGQSLQGAGQMGQLGATYAGLENQTRGIQMQGNLAEQSNAAASHTAKDQINTGVNVHNADRDMDYIKMIAGGMSGGAQTGMAGAPPSAAGPPTGGAGPKLPPTSDPLAKTGIFGLGSGVGGGVDMGSKGSISAGDVQAASTGLSSGGGIGVQVGGGGITGGGGTPGGAGGGAGTGASFLGLDLSDPKAKTEVLPLTDMPGKRLQIGSDDRAFYASEAHDDGRPSLEGPTPRFSSHATPQRSAPAQAKPRAMTHDELLAAANALGSGMRSDHDARMAAGPAVSDPRAKEDAFRLGQVWGSMVGDPGRGSTSSRLDSMAGKAADNGLMALATPAPVALGGAAFNIAGSHALTSKADKARAEERGPSIEFGPAEVENDLRVEMGPAEVERGPFVEFGPAVKEEPVARKLVAKMPRPSDPRAKELGGVHDNEVAQTLDATPAVSYRYKDPSYEPEAQRPGEQQAGFLTSDLKKTPLGAAVVEKRPDGLEGYNEHRLNGLQHAEIRNLHERLRELEAKLAGGRHGRG